MNFMHRVVDETWQHCEKVVHKLWRGKWTYRLRLFEYPNVYKFIIFKLLFDKEYFKDIVFWTINEFVLN